MWISENTERQHWLTAAQIVADCGNFPLDLKQHGFCASILPPDSDFQIESNIYLDLKRVFWAIKQQLYFFSPYTIFM